MQVAYEDRNTNCCGTIRRRTQPHINQSMVTLAQDLNALTVQQREKIYNEVHGVADIIDEKPEFVSECLTTMRKCLESEIPPTRKKAMDRAVFLRPSIRSDDKFHLMFLRARQFDSSKAALLMTQYFENKLELFGDEVSTQTYHSGSSDTCGDLLTQGDVQPHTARQ